MKLLYVINTLNYGGAAKMLKYVANLSSQRFKEIKIISLHHETTNLPSGLNPDIEIINLGTANVPRSIRWIIMIKNLRDAIKQYNPDIVFSFISHVAVITKFAMTGLRNKFIVSAERGDPYTLSPIWKRLVTWTYCSSDLCFFQLDKARDFFPQKVSKKSFVIPNPHIPTSEPFYGKRNHTIVSAGRFAPEKGYDMLIRAYANIQKKYPDYRLILWGDGPLLESYKTLIDNLGITDKVRFPGYASPVAPEMREEGVFVLSSLNEGIPNSLIEAMSVGIPTISTRCSPGGPEFLSHNGECGLLINIGNQHELEEKLIWVIEHPIAASELGKRGAESVRELDVNIISEKWNSAFDYIISRLS